MIYGEIGKYPISVKIKMRMIKFLVKLTKGNGKKLSEIMLRAMIDNETNTTTFKWLNGIKTILRETGYPYLIPQIRNIQHHTSAIQQNLIDQSIQNINTDSSKCLYYTYLKDKPGMPHYLKCLSEKHTLSLLKFRTSNHRLPVEVGRYTNIDRHNRLCPFCLATGDEFHFLFLCKHFKHARQKYIHRQYTDRPNMYKYYKLMNTDDTQQLQNLAIFVSIITKMF